MRIGPLDTASLRTRLVLIPTVIVFAGLLVTLALVLSGARGRVEAEGQSSFRFGGLLIQDTLREIARAPDPGAAFAEFARNPPQLRHVRIAIGRIETAPAKARPAPEWFVNRLTPPPQTQLFPVNLPGVPDTVISMRSAPLDEIGEIWDEVVLLAGILVSVWLAMVIVLAAVIGWVLRPVRDLARAFTQLEQGQYPVLPPLAVSELREAGGQFNLLVQSLAQVTEDNRKLIGRLMEGQDSERREIAHELHDEIGPALFGIRAETALIRRLAAPAEGADGEIGARASAIALLADGLQRAVYRMLESLRPLVLEELGLGDALLALGRDWESRRAGLSVSLDLPPAMPALGDQEAVTLYRAAQECLTNAIRHGDATRIAVVLALAPGGGVSLSVRDNGGGLAPGFRYGFGLLGMNERARRLGGALRVTAAEGGGALVQIALPSPAGGER
jgi:two-component system sensor histidine kinase UhpB